MPDRARGYLPFNELNRGAVRRVDFGRHVGGFRLWTAERPDAGQLWSEWVKPATRGIE